MKDIENGEVVLDKPLLSDCPSDVRSGFVKRVYALLLMQLLLTGGTTALMVFDATVNDFVQSTPELIIVAAVGGLCTICPLFAYKSRHPYNLIFLLLFTLFESYTTGFVVITYASLGMGTLIVWALGATMLVFGVLTCVVHFTGKDMTGLGPYLMTGLVALLLICLVGMIMPTMLMNGIIASLGMLVFSGLVLYDTSLMLKYMGPDDAVIAAVQLYLDFVNLFLYILALLQSCQDP